MKITKMCPFLIVCVLNYCQLFSFSKHLVDHIIRISGMPTVIVLFALELAITLLILMSHFFCVFSDPGFEDQFYHNLNDEEEKSLQITDDTRQYQ